MFFAGIWREWEGDRGTKTIPDGGNHRVFSFLTTDASPEVAPIPPTPHRFFYLMKARGKRG